MRRVTLIIALPVMLWAQLSVNGWVQGRTAGVWDIEDSLSCETTAVQLSVLPGLLGKFWYHNQWTADLEWRAQALSYYQNLDGFEGHSEQVKLYRGWFRLYSPYTEFRIGYQQLNFGPGRMIRVLNWFDSISYLDPQKMTAGVWGARMQLFYHNNASLWFWMLYGNEDDKYSWWHIQKDVPEWGGRVEMPFLNGEIGISGHYREISEGLLKGIERHAGLDGMWDPFAGIWFESSLMSTDMNDNSETSNWLRWDHVTGIDYTFGVGNGLNVAGEWLIYGIKTKPSDINAILRGWTLYHTLGGYISYPLSILDQLTAAIYASEDIDYLSGTLNWTRSTDQWTFNCMASNFTSNFFNEKFTKRHRLNLSLQMTRYF